MRRKDFQTSDWLEWFIDEEFMPICRLEDGRRFGTTGTVCVVTMVDGFAQKECSKLKIPGTIARLLTDKAETSKIIPFTVLAKIAGPCEYPRDEKCSGCECGYCEGNYYKVDPESRRRLIFGDPINANLVALVMEHCPPCDRVTIEKCKSTHGGGKMTWFLRIIGESWVAIISGMLPIEEERHVEREVPELMTDEYAMDLKHA